MTKVTGDITRNLLDLADAADGGMAMTLDYDLVSGTPDRRLEFGFEFRGIPLVVRADAVGQATQVKMRASLGILPFSAQDSESRATALAILDAASADIGGNIRLDDQQRVVFVETFVTENILTPAVLMTSVAKRVLRAKPYLELLALVVPPPLSDSSLSQAQTTAS